MRRAERASFSSAYQLFRAYLHTHPRKRVQRPEPKSDAERTRLGLPLREPWFEVKPFDEKKKRFVLRLKDLLQAQPRQRMEVAAMALLRRELDVLREGKQRKMATYVRRFPAAFALHSVFTANNKRKTWCTFTEDARKLLEEEDTIFQASKALLVQKLRKILMISVKKRLPLATVEQVRQSLGLPVDFKESLVSKFPDVFLLKERKGSVYLELKEWDETLAISVLEKNTHEGKYEKKNKKKKRPKLPIQESRQEATSKIDAEHRSFSKGDENRAILTEEEEECEQGGSTIIDEKDCRGNDEDKNSIDKLHSSRESISEGDEQEDTFSAGHVKEVLSSLVAESTQKDNVATLNAGLDGGEQIDVENSVAEPREPPTASYLDLNPRTPAALVLGLNDHESTDSVGINKDGQLQLVSNLDNSESKGRKQLPNIQVTPGNSACLRFPWITKKGRQPKPECVAQIESFQSVPYISPYRNSRELVLPPLKTLQTDKFLVGLIHEFLSLTLEKRATVQQLELFQRPYQLPVNLLDFLLKYDGIFYVARGRKKSHVFLKEGYKEFHLLDKDPLVLWQERFVELAFSSLRPEKHETGRNLSSQDAQDLSDED